MKERKDDILSCRTRYGIEAILLTAGKSSRMGQDKALLEINGRKVINVIIEKLIACVGRHGDLPVHAPSRIIIILGYHHDIIKNHIEEQFLDKIKIIYNENHLDGMYSSIKKGVSALSGENHFILQMIDQPFIEQELYHKIVDEYDGESPILQPFYLAPKLKTPPLGGWGAKKKGHPIIINKKLISLIKNDRKSKSLRDFFTPYYKNIQLVEYDKSSILQNLNNYKSFEEAVEKNKF